MKKNNLARKLAFASADLFGGGSFNIINFLYPVFLVLIVGINPFWSSFIILVARIFDAVIDPIIGWISDRTQSKFGKRRIYLIICSPLIVVAMFLMFYPFNFSNEALQVIAVLLAYLIFVAVQSTIMIPYFSLASEISRDYQNRASFNSYRLAFSIFSSIICVAVPKIIVDSFADPRIGYQVMSLSFGIFFGISILLSGLFAKEEIKSPIVKTKLSFKALAEPLKLKPFRQYLGMFLFMQIAMSVMSGLFFFYIDFYIIKDVTASGGTSMVGTIAAALMFFTQIVALPFYLKMIEKFSKAFTYRFGAIIWIVSAIGLFFVPANVNPVVIYILAVVMGFGISAPGLIPHTMFGDVADAGQLKFKKRIEGQMSGFSNFVSQIAQALGLSFAMFILGLAGFKERVPGQPPILTQPDGSLLAIRTIMALAPLILLGIGSLISLSYRIDAKEQQKLKEQISLQDDEPLNAESLS
ncbi:MAG TPA: MFS transporter [Bacilli bacterium]|nr:MFS transporter [Bacilli bacterium]